MKFLKRNIIMIAVLAFIFCAVGSHAATVSSMLKTTQTKVNTSVLTNTTGKVRFVCSNGNTSNHKVWAEFYSGKTKTRQITRIKLEDLDPIDTSNPYNFSRYFQGIPKGTCSARTFELKKADHKYIKGTTFGNSINEPFNGCIASTQIGTK